MMASVSKRRDIDCELVVSIPRTSSKESSEIASMKGVHPNETIIVLGESGMQHKRYPPFSTTRIAIVVAWARSVLFDQSDAQVPSAMANQEKTAASRRTIKNPAG